MKKLIIILITIVAIIGGGYLIFTNLFIDDDKPEVEEKPAEIVFKLINIERIKELPGDLKPEKSSNEFLVISIKGQNYDSTTRKYNVFYLNFEDVEGKIYENAINTRLDALKYGDLEPSMSITGSVVFEVPEGISGKLMIEDEKGNEIQSLKIK